MDNSLNILIAEDEYIVLRGLKETLTDLGHNVIGEAMDGETFVKLALEKDPDLLIVDVNLPALSGIEAIERIAKVKLVPSIIVTGYSSEETVKRANSVGVFNYLVKPVDEKELKPAIDIAMGRFKEFALLKKELHEQEEALEARKLIERAKGILMDRNGIKESEAMKLLQKISRDKNLKLVVVAREIIEADNTLHYGM
ncbi:Fis family transcriptional regulator [Mesotoga sp. H07pep.5.4]|jgi:response regulator NasT|uniref:ANTAR domain-containing response regulator n=1 Tax=Mesotoga sp. H07pep.5.4 TaxID=1463664 RepID=UPI000EF14E80|nr:response regulator [Mesotoga sp. H07pep.5.4]MDK2945134.1 two-component system, response regulator PdtaR [Mesotoga sp.]RLL82458.1 Fis family transcriptional regulator [Mesotoga sp. H07pep.5.4]